MNKNFRGEIAFCVLVSQVMRKLQKKLPFCLEDFSIKAGHGSQHSDRNLGLADRSKLAANDIVGPKDPRGMEGIRSQSIY